MTPTKTNIKTGYGSREIPFTCGSCPATWTGTRMAHCAQCHRTFGGVRNFDHHRSYNRCAEPWKLGLTWDAERHAWTEPRTSRNETE